MKKGSKVAPAKSSAAKYREKYDKAHQAWKEDKNNQAKERAFFKLDPPILKSEAKNEDPHCPVYRDDRGVYL